MSREKEFGGSPIGSPLSADQQYFDGLARGEFAIPRCEECERAIFYPRVVCPHCGSERLVWFRPSGNGTVYSTTTVRGRDDTYNVCLVDLDEGVRLMSRVVDMDSTSVSIGQRVRARVQNDGATALLVFDVVER